MGKKSRRESIVEDVKNEEPVGDGLFDDEMGSLSPDDTEAILTPLGNEDRIYRFDFEDRRKMRKIAFYGVSGIIFMFFIVLLIIMFRLFIGSYLMDTVSYLNARVLTFLAGGLFILAGIPLSLSSVLVKMISDKRDDDGNEIRIPSVELVKAITTILKK